jgi:hypothetical protein
VTVAEKKRFLLRISPELWEELNRWAADELRSVNSQIEFLLRQAVLARRRGRARSGPVGDGDRET